MSIFQDDPRLIKSSKHIIATYFTVCLFLMFLISACDDANTESNESTAMPIAGVNAGAEAGDSTGTESGESAGTNSTGQAGMESGTQADGQVGCELDEVQTQNALQFMQNYCALCHGETPAYGAPYSLLDTSTWHTETNGASILERSVSRLVEGSMPPVGQPHPPVDLAQAFIDLVTCNQGPQISNPPGGFSVNRPIYQNDQAIPTDADIAIMTANQTPVDMNKDDDYQCFSFISPTQDEDERLIVRFEPVIDEARVVHHIVLYETNVGPGDGSSVSCGAGLEAAIYAWAPGQNPLQFKAGGLVSKAGQKYTLEIHYNNSAGYTDVQDSSGVRIYHKASEGPRIDMMTLGPDAFSLPARTRTMVEGDCQITEDLSIVALMPHMHEIGDSLSSDIYRVGQGDMSENLIELTGWDFNYQLVYDADHIQLSAGDRIRTRCIFENDSDQRRNYGPFTEDEMCYHFIYVTPPPSEKRCNVPVEEVGDYQFGMCVPEDLRPDIDTIFGSYHQGETPMVTGGDILYGTYTLSDLQIWFEDFDLGIATVDPEMSFYEGGGMLNLSEDGDFIFDLQGLAHLTSEQGAMFMRSVNLSFAGMITQSENQELAIDISCPSDIQLNLPYIMKDNEISIYFYFNDPVPGVQISTFKLQE